MSIWFKHDAHFHEHPKCLRLRRLAGSKSDSAEVGWWRIVAAAKRIGEWSFEDEDHLKDAAGRYYGFVRLYREVGLLDGLTIHNGTEYQAPMSGAERVKRHRQRNDASVTPDVTDVTPRVEKSREEKSNYVTHDVTSDDDPPWLTAWFATGRHRLPTPAQQGVIDGYLRAFDVTGPDRLSRLFLSHPDNPIGAAKDDLAEHRAAARTRAAEAEAESAARRKPRGLTGVNAELAAFLREKDGAA